MSAAEADVKAVVELPANAVRPSQLEDFLNSAIPRRRPVLITGKPGVGKTDIATRVSLNHSAILRVWHPVVDDPTDYKGAPFVRANADHADFVPFANLHELMTAKSLTVVFLDDLGQAPPSVQAAAMQLLLARSINGKKISDYVTFIAATNGRQHRSGVAGLFEPVKGRFVTILELVPDFNEWSAWAGSNGMRGEVIAYLSSQTQYLSELRPVADLMNSPCPRTWAFISEQLDYDLKVEGTLRSSICGALGPEVGMEFYAFLKVWKDAVKPATVFRAPDTAPIPTKIDALSALSISLAMQVEKKTMDAYATYLNRMTAVGKMEYAATSLVVAAAREPKLRETKGYQAIVTNEAMNDMMTGGGR